MDVNYDYDPTCIHRRDDDTCECSCNECSMNCPFYDTSLLLFEKTSLEELGKRDYQESGFAAGVEHQKKRSIDAFKKVIDLMYSNDFDPCIDYMEMFTENL